jgi:hypothetical protein
MANGFSCPDCGYSPLPGDANCPNCHNAVTHPQVVTPPTR